MDCNSMNTLHFGDPTKSTGRSVRKYSHVQRSPEHPGPSNCVSRCHAHATWRGHRLGITESLPGVSVVQTVAPASANRKPRGFLPAHRDQRPPETVRQTLIRLVCNSFPLKSLQQTLHPHDHLAHCPRHCHQVARVQQQELLVAVLMTMMIHHAQQV